MNEVACPINGTPGIPRGPGRRVNLAAQAG